MPLTLNTWHSPEHEIWRTPVISITGETPALSINGYCTAFQLRAIARQLITIANDSDQGEQGPATYTVED